MAQAAQNTQNPAPRKLPFWAMHTGVKIHISDAEAAAHNAAVKADRAKVARPNSTGLAPHLACFTAIKQQED